MFRKCFFHLKLDEYFIEVQRLELESSELDEQSERVAALQTPLAPARPQKV
jgi:hypothetical protein